MGNQNLHENDSRTLENRSAGMKRAECRHRSEQHCIEDPGESRCEAPAKASVCGLVNINAHRFGRLIGKSPAIRKVFQDIARTAPSKASVVIYGESGTGKELVAQTIHSMSPRRKNCFVPVNCGAIPSELIESEFFGHMKGAFTGAAVNKPGFLDLAEGGTLFLDEVGELSAAMQVKLLRAIDGGGYNPIGSQVVKKPDFRIIAATNRDLRNDVRKGLMREDFYYRINVLPLYLPSLRERKEDLPLLISHFLVRFGQDQDIPVIPSNLMAKLESYDWPGNIRELQNTIQRYIALKEIDNLGCLHKAGENAEYVLPETQYDQSLKSALSTFEAHYIAQSLKAMNWHQGKTCDVLGINRKTLYKKIQQYGLKKIPSF